MLQQHARGSGTRAASGRPVGPRRGPRERPRFSSSVPLRTMPAGSAAGPAARRSADPDPGVELGDPERLRDVVVGARLERLDLGSLLAPRGQDEDRRRAPRGGPGDDHEQAVASGSPRSSRMRSGRRASQARRASAAVARLLDSVAVRGQVPGDLRPRRGVVLDDEDRSHRSTGRARSVIARPQPARPAPAVPRGGRLAAGRGRRPGRRVAAPRFDPCRPSPRSARGRRPARCRSRDATFVAFCGARKNFSKRCGSASVRDARPGVLDGQADRHRVRQRPRSGSADPPGRTSAHSRAGWPGSGRRTPGRRGLAGSGGRQVGLQRRGRRGACRSRSSVRLDQVVDGEGLTIRAQGARLDPAQVQQVRDEPIEVLRLPVDRLGARFPVGRRQSLTSRSRGCRRPPGSWPAASAGRGTPTRAAPS